MRTEFLSEKFSRDYSVCIVVLERIILTWVLKK
jgi:hypothetical protein